MSPKLEIEKVSVEEVIEVTKTEDKSKIAHNNHGLSSPREQEKEKSEDIQSSDPTPSTNDSLAYVELPLYQSPEQEHDIQQEEPDGIDAEPSSKLWPKSAESHDSEKASRDSLMDPDTVNKDNDDTIIIENQSSTIAEPKSSLQTTQQPSITEAETQVTSATSEEETSDDAAENSKESGDDNQQHRATEEREEVMVCDENAKSHTLHEEEYFTEDSLSDSEAMEETSDEEYSPDESIEESSAGSIPDINIRKPSGNDPITINNQDSDTQLIHHSCHAEDIVVEDNIIGSIPAVLPRNIPVTREPEHFLKNDEKNFSCQLCSATSTSITCIKNHIVRTHKIQRTLLHPPKAMCKKCNKEIRDRTKSGTCSECKGMEHYKCTETGKKYMERYQNGLPFTCVQCCVPGVNFLPDLSVRNTVQNHAETENQPEEEKQSHDETQCLDQPQANNTNTTTSESMKQVKQDNVKLTNKINELMMQEQVRKAK